MVDHNVGCSFISMVTGHIAGAVEAVGGTWGESRR
jgi:hypothetical protein